MSEVVKDPFVVETLTKSSSGKVYLLQADVIQYLRHMAELNPDAQVVLLKAASALGALRDLEEGES